VSSPSIYDVSKQANVSIATISRVVNGKGKVGEKTRARVLKTIEEMGYTPNALARGLSTNNSIKTVGLLSTDSTDLYHSRAIFFLERELRKSGYDSILCCTGYDPVYHESRLKLLLSKQVDAVVLISSYYLHEDDNAYIRNASKKVPVMMMNAAVETEGVYSFICDDRQATCSLTTRFIEQGRKRLVHIHHSDTFSSRQKLAGICDALDAHGLDRESLILLQCENDIHAAMRAIEKLVKDGEFFNGVICPGDGTAVGALKGLARQRIRVPEEVAVTGYNNSIIARSSSPEITSVDNVVEDICVAVVDGLMRLFGGEEIPRTNVFEARLVQRESAILTKN